MLFTSRSIPVPYAVAALAVLAALLVRWPLGPVLGHSIPYLTFFPAVVLAAYVGGLRPGLLATALSAVATVFVLGESPSFFATLTGADGVGLALFVVVGVFLSVLSESLHKARGRAEEEAVRLRASEAQFRMLADSIPQLAWMARPDGHIFWYNRRWYDYTGTTPEQMEGWGWQAVHDASELPRVLENWKTALAGAQPWEDTFPLRRHDGAMRAHLSRAEPVRDERGRVVRWFGTNTDITERMEMEAALRRQAEQLREADRRKDEFLSMLAHELRNPLAPMLTSLQILRKAGTDPDVRREAVDRMERQVRNLSDMVGDLLDVSRVARGRVSLRPERHDLARLVRTVAEDLRALLAQAGLTLAVETPETPVWTRGDPLRLTQVLSNLLDNSGKYTDRGGRVVVRVIADAARGQAVISVEDTGAGIEPTLLPRIFEAFAQGEQSVDRPHGGLGLGLAVVKGLVELHGGSVAAASAGPGRGAEFTVRLPLEPEPAGLTGGPARPPAGELRHKVLIIEDNRDTAESLRMLLELLGHEVRLAFSGPEGVQAASAWRPDAVVTDIGLPGFDGYEVARRIRRLPGMEGALLVALTGYGGDEDRRRGRDAGFDHHLVKPADPMDLQRVLAGRVA